MLHKTSIKTKMGWVSIFEENGKIFQIKFGKTRRGFDSYTLRNFKKNLTKFFNKKTQNIKGKYQIKGNKIQKRVWNELKKIKSGKTKTYGHIAKKLHLSPRHVGKICAQNKLLLVVPCHRVIKSDGTLGGFSSSGGIKLKKKLLDFEKED